MDLELTVSAKLAVRGATGFSCASQLCNVDAPLLTEGKAWQSDRTNGLIASKADLNPAGAVPLLGGSQVLYLPSQSL